jgi:4'-phosphopantetheinyl transferase EntD
VIAEILPDKVVVEWMREDVVDAALFPEEERVVARAVEKRRREFTTGRACARAALARLAVPAQPVPSGDHGEPIWPPGIVGSITHCDGYRACAVARGSDVQLLGIDAEFDAPLPAGVLEAIARPEERGRIDELGRAVPGVCWDRVLFSGKESVFKALFPLTRYRLGYEEASLAIDEAAGTFTARVLAPPPASAPRAPSLVRGRWAVRDGLLFTAIAAGNAFGNSRKPEAASS